MIRTNLSSDIVRQLQLSLDRMLPSGVGAFADKIADNEKAFEYTEEGAHLSKAVPKRRNEFIAGRRCARAALARIGIRPCKLMPGKDRAPQWPTGAIGSISHSTALCCAVTAHSNKFLCLGVDLEMTTRMSPEVVKRVIHPLEAGYVGGDQVRGSLIFSAKEAFFKAQFATWKAWPNFDDLAFHVDTSTSQLKVISVADHLLSDLRSAAVDMQYRYTFFDNYVLTLCWLEKV